MAVMIESQQAEEEDKVTGMGSIWINASNARKDLHVEANKQMPGEGIVSPQSAEPNYTDQWALVS